MEQPKEKIIIVAGEASGDMHAAHLVKAVHRLNPNITFSGLGGPQMQTAGVKLYEDLTQFAVVGFIEVIKHYQHFKRAFNLILKHIDAEQPKAVILVDYPGFNLRLARELKKRQIKVIYYISPQVWAWKEQRVHFIKKHVDAMLVLFPFEQDFYARHGMDVTFVGHPLLDTVKVKTSKEDILQSKGLSLNKLTIGLLPGSRQKEIDTLLPVMRDAATILHREFPQTQFCIIKAPTIAEKNIQEHLQQTTFPHVMVKDNIYDGINACDLCMVASGTATLETAILEKPMVIIYKTSLLTWLLAKLFIKIKNIGLVNVVAGKRIVPECVQFQATAEIVAGELKEMITNELKIADIKSDLRAVRKTLGSGGASLRAAEEILKIINA